MATRRDEIERLAEASAWRVALAEAEAETSEGFEAWLAADPANAAAWDQVQDSWTEVGDHAHSPEMLRLRQAALGRARREGRRRWNAADWLPRVAASILLLAIALSGLFYYHWETSRPLVYATALGERRVVTLEDGSKVSLDANSEVAIRYTGDARRLELLQGQARFDVAKDVMRPFSVHALDRLIVATGTAFNIDLGERKVAVTLIQGKVSIFRAPVAPRTFPAAKDLPPGKAVALEAGEQFVAQPQAPPRVDTVAVDRATAWEQGQLIFEDETLDAIAARVSRYSAKPVTVTPDAANLRISGVFVTGDVSTFVDTVTRYLPVQANRQEDGSVELQRRGA